MDTEIGTTSWLTTVSPSAATVATPSNSTVDAVTEAALVVALPSSARWTHRRSH